MFGLMEIQELLSSYSNLYPDMQVGIVPTVLLPLAFLSTGISVVATFVAGLFGVKLKAEGPRKLLELLLRPRILISAMILNAVIFFGYKGYEHIKNGPVPLKVQSFMNSNIEFLKAPLAKSNGLHWEQNIGEGIFASGKIVGKELFVGTKEGHLYVVNLENGKVTNKIFFGKFLSPTPVLYKGYLFFGEGLHASHHMRVYKFDPMSKKIVGAYKTKGHTEIFPVMADLGGKDYLYQAAGSDGLHAIDPISLKKRWHFKDGHMDAFSLIDGNDLYIASGVPKEEIGIKRPYAYKLNAMTGKLIWKKELPLSSWYGPIKSGKNICFIQGELHVKSQIGGLNCFSPSGERLSSVIIESPVIGKPLVSGENIIFNDFNGGVYSWNSSSGVMNWKYAGEKKGIKYSYSSVQYRNDGNLIFINPRGSIAHLNIDSGKVLKLNLFKKGEAVFADPLVLKSGYIVFGMKGSIKFYKKAAMPESKVVLQ